MTKTTEELVPTSTGPGTVGGGRRRRRLAIAVTAAVAVMLLVAAAMVAWLGGDGDETTTTATAPSNEAPATTGGPSTTGPPTTQRPTTTTAGEDGTAAEVLEPFLTAAATLDGQLQAAATAINGGGPLWTNVSEEMASAVQTAMLEPVAETIPSGLPNDLLQSVILVYSDLSSRRHAMQSFTYPGATSRETAELLAELANGHAAATRFDDDLAVLRSQAASSPPVTVARPDSRAAAEALLYVQYVDLANGGCDSRGGAVFAELPALDWIPSEFPDASEEGRSEWDGHVGGIEFSADLNPNGTWDIVIWAC